VKPEQGHAARAEPDQQHPKRAAERSKGKGRFFFRIAPFDAFPKPKIKETQNCRGAGIPQIAVAYGKKYKANREDVAIATEFGVPQ
ncbi:MAG: hypothetical protein HXO77_10010, partial [Selenomonas sp.]|nr:hypothetical protein [Selenomonas sp.]